MNHTSSCSNFRTMEVLTALQLSVFVYVYSRICMLDCGWTGLKYCHKNYSGYYLIQPVHIILWSQLMKLLKRYREDISEVALDIVSKSAEIVDLVTILGASTERENGYNFIAEQLNLLCLSPHRYRYKTDTVIVAFQIYHKSPYCYMELQQLPCLPSIRMLQDVSSSLQVGDNSNCITFLQSKAAMLKPSELLINIQLGNAENKEQAASRIQCFINSRITSKNKDVISLTPVQNMTYVELSKLMLQVITNVTNAGFRIVSIISDTNVVNRKSFMLISGSDTLKQYIWILWSQFKKSYYLI